MARGVVVLDENRQELLSALQAHNIRVIVPPAGLSDDKIKHALLPHRIFITSNPDDFRDDAVPFEYGIIALDKLSFIDPLPGSENKTAQLISKALSGYDLWSRNHGFVLSLRDSGSHQLESLDL